MKFNAVVHFITALLLLSGAFIPILASSEGARDAGITRAAGEELTIEVRVTFESPLDLDIRADIYIHKLILNGTLRSSEEIRDIYSLLPDSTLASLDSEMRRRVGNVTDSMLSGGMVEMVSSFTDNSSLDNSTTMESDPIHHIIELKGHEDMDRYLEGSRADLLEDGREDLFITSLFLSGFTFSRSLSLTALEGQYVTYMIEDSFDPLGDGAVELELQSYDRMPVDGFYNIVVDGTGGEARSYFTFILSASRVFAPSSEIIHGSMIIDWERLDAVSISGSLEISSVSTDRSEMLTTLPPSMTAPPFVPAALIGYSHLEGVLTSADLEEMESSISSEVTDTVRTALSDDTARAVVSLDTGSGNLTRPSSGSELITIFSADEPVTAEVSTEGETVLDVLDGYEADDVLGLLNGGLRIYHEMEQITDDRFDVEIMLPPHLFFDDEQPDRTVGGRNVYVYSPGRKLIASSLAPHFDGDELSVKGRIDISRVRTWYVADIEMDVDIDLNLGLGAMKFDPGDMEFSTPLDFELDYLSSDMIRLLMDMGIIDRQKVEDKVEGDLNEGLADIMPDRNDSFRIDLVDESLDFDGDIYNMTSDEHIIISVWISGTLAPMKELRKAGKDENDDSSPQNQILPFHLDPILPLYTYERNIDLEDAARYDIDLYISVPSGIGLRAWAGNGDQDRIREFEVDTSEGYPTIHIDLEPGEADRIRVQVKVGAFVAVNNIKGCFACCILGLVMILLIFLLVTLKIARKRKARREAAEETAGEGEEEGDGRDDEGSGDEKSDKKEKAGKGKKKRKSRGRKKKGKEEEELTWDD